MSDVSKPYIYVTKSHNANPTVDDFKQIIAKLQTQLNKTPGLFQKYHTNSHSLKNFEMELILNPDKLDKGYYHIKDLIKSIKSPLFNIEYFGE